MFEIVVLVIWLFYAMLYIHMVNEDRAIGRGDSLVIVLLFYVAKIAASLLWNLEEFRAQAN